MPKTYLIAKFVAWAVGGLVTLSVIGTFRWLPFSACVAPWVFQVEGDQEVNNSDVCAIDFARYLGNVPLCDLASSRWSVHENCISIAAVHRKDPLLCIDSFVVQQQQFSCLMNIQRQLRSKPLCNLLSDPKSTQLCEQAYEKATE